MNKSGPGSANRVPVHDVTQTVSMKHILISMNIPTIFLGQGQIVSRSVPLMVSDDIIAGKI